MRKASTKENKEIAKDARKPVLETYIESAHAGGRYLCDHCDYKTTQVGTLKEYVESVHEESIYSCPHCGFKENGVRNLKHHVDAVQKKRVPSVNSINNITGAENEEDHGGDMKPDEEPLNLDVKEGLGNVENEDNKERKETFKREENESKEIIENILKIPERFEETTKPPSQGSNLEKSTPKTHIESVHTGVCCPCIQRILMSRNTNEQEKFDSVPKDPRE